MAWSYTPGQINSGWIEGDTLQIQWEHQWTVSEVPSTNPGSIRLRLVIETSEFWVYRKGYKWNTGYNLYVSDSIECDGTKLYFRQNALVNNGGYNFTGEIDVPNSWVGKTVKFNISLKIFSTEFGAHSTHTLSITAGSGSSLSVNRAASNVGATGSLSNGSVIYSEDNLTISATPNANYRISSLTVNNNEFINGNTYSVVGDTNVVSTAQILASDVGATDADIETTSTITIVRYDNSYVHTLEYSFGSLSGYITASGGTSASREIITGTSVPFAVPSAFYAQIPNAQTGLCTITCKTYASSTSTETLGDPTTCTFTARASASRCSPTVAETVVDINPVTTALTQDSSKIVRYKSTARCTIAAAARNSATLSELTINGHILQNGATSIDLTGDELTNRSIRFTATDSRGFTTVLDTAVTLIPYVMLTCNPEFSRNTPTDGNMNLTFNGKMYTGEWRSGISNRLTIRFRYRANDASQNYSNWMDISDQYTMQTSGYFSGTGTSQSAIALTRPDGESGYDYRNAYRFQIEVTDGDGTNVCSTVTREFVVQQGIPVFDWGKNDFRFNVPIILSDGNEEITITAGQLKNLLALLSQ